MTFYEELLESFYRHPLSPLIPDESQFRDFLRWCFGPGFPALRVGEFRKAWSENHPKEFPFPAFFDEHETADRMVAKYYQRAK